MDQRFDSIRETRLAANEKRVLFISHAAVDEELARFLKEAIERSFQGIDVFVSSDPEDLPIGSPWVEEILTKLQAAKLVLVLGTERGLGRKWVWFEAGAGWSGRRQVFTACVGKLRKNNLPPPFSLYTAANLDEESECEVLFSAIKTEFAANQAATDYAGLCRSLIRLDVRAEERQKLSQVDSASIAFQDVQRQVLIQKLASLDAPSRDLLRLLSVYGELDGGRIHSAALVPQQYVGSLLESVEKTGIVHMRTVQGNVVPNRFWKLNPELSDKLKPLLFPRRDDEGPPRFRL
jgi:hypothetical protein